MVVGSEWYAALFPALRWAKETGLELITTQGGSRYATSVGGTLTGRGADLIIVDDPLNANEVHSEPARKRVIDWYGGALVSRLNDKQTGSIVAVMQRLHERLVHYRTPTEPASSGSPVFNTEWQVIDLHHGGSAKAPRLHAAGDYEANEAISLSAIRAAIQRGRLVA
jgi:hypothetical protein